MCCPLIIFGVKTVVDGAMRKPICVHKVVQTSKKSRENEDKGTHYVLSGKYKDEAKANLRKIGALLWLQPDPDKVQTNFPSAYLIDVDNKDGGSCWGKASPQNESSFAYNVFFLVLSDSAKKLPKLMGQKTLLEYIKICNTYLMCWKHSSESTQNSKCTPLPIGISMWVTVG